MKKCKDGSPCVHFERLKEAILLLLAQENSKTSAVEASLRDKLVATTRELNAALAKLAAAKEAGWEENEEIRSPSVDLIERRDQMARGHPRIREIVRVAMLSSIHSAYAHGNFGHMTPAQYRAFRREQRAEFHFLFGVWP